MISQHQVDQAFTDLRATCGGLREDYFGLLYLEREHGVPREKALNCIAFGGNDYGVDGFHFDKDTRNLYIFQFKYTNAYVQFKVSLKRLIDAGMARIFATANKDDAKNQILLQLRGSLIENKTLIDQVYIRFVFTGDPSEAERSQVLDKLREDLENKKYLIDQFFSGREVGLIVDFRSASGRVGTTDVASHTTTFTLNLAEVAEMAGPTTQKMYVGFVRLADLHSIHVVLKSRFFDRNIRYWLGGNQAVNTSIKRSLRKIIIDRVDDPRTFAFNHNGITLFAEKVERAGVIWKLTMPRLLNGAQTISTVADFRKVNDDDPRLKEGQAAFEAIHVLCKIIAQADQDFVTSVTINNNRQNPVEPWNLHANDEIQLELQDKFRDDLGIYYERQENAFDQLSAEDLEEYGIREDARSIQMLKLTQTFLLTDGNVSRLSEMRRVFEDDKAYDQVFRPARLKADFRKIVLCYKVHFRLRKLMAAIEEQGPTKYSFIARARYLLWALVSQGLLNRDDIDKIANKFGTSMVVPTDYSDLLITLATTRVKPLLSALMKEPEYADKVSEGNLSFLRTDTAFEKCMGIAHGKWKWTHRKLQ